MFYYSTSVFEDIIDKPLVGTTSTGAVNVVFTYIALLLMDRCPRKSLVLWSIGGMFFACIMLICSQAGVWNDSSGITALVSVNAYVAFYAIGIGPIPVLWITEMVPPRFVSLTMSVCSQLNWMANFLVGLAFPLMREQFEEWTFVPFAVVLFVSFLFVWRVLPQKRESAANCSIKRHHHEPIPNNGRDGLMKTHSIRRPGTGELRDLGDQLHHQQWEETKNHNTYSVWA